MTRGERSDQRERIELATERATERVRRFSETAIKTPANVVTLVRLLFSVPVLVWILDEGDATWGTFAGWMVLWLTDGLDGWLARRDGTTRSGAFLDPLADKVLVIGGFLALGVRGDIGWIRIVLVVGREAGIQVYRSLAGRRGISLPARQLGKWKTTLQFAAVGAFLFPPFEDMAWLQQTVLWVAVALTLLSALDMLRRGWQESRA